MHCKAWHSTTSNHSSTHFNRHVLSMFRNMQWRSIECVRMLRLMWTTSKWLMWWMTVIGDRSQIRRGSMIVLNRFAVHHRHAKRVRADWESGRPEWFTHRLDPQPRSSHVSLELILQTSSNMTTSLVLIRNYYYYYYYYLSLIHIWRCRRYSLCRSRSSPNH